MAKNAAEDIRSTYKGTEDIDYAEPGAITKKPPGAGQPYPALDPYRNDRYCQTVPDYGFNPDAAHDGGGDKTYMGNGVRGPGNLAGDNGTKDDNDRWTGR